MTGPAKINHLCTKIADFFHTYLLSHNLQNIRTNRIEFLTLLQNLRGFLMKFTEMGYHIQN